MSYWELYCGPGWVCKQVIPFHEWRKMMVAVHVSD